MLPWEATLVSLCSVVELQNSCCQRYRCTYVVM